MKLDFFKKFLVMDVPFTEYYVIRTYQPEFGLILIAECLGYNKKDLHILKM